MMRLSDYPIFARHTTTLKETSKDKEHEVYMTESLRPAIHFDKVKDEYTKKLGMSQAPQSNDALFAEDDEGSIVFVEFRNGTVREFKVRKKIYDSVLIYTDITSGRISAMRKSAKFILVYNESKATECKTEDKAKTFVPPSESYDVIAKETSKLGNQVYVKFGLGIFKNYCFKEVYTYTQDEFEEYLRRSEEKSCGMLQDGKKV